MANPINHAQRSEETMQNKVQPYMAGLFQRLATNYTLLILAIVVVNTIGVRLLLGLLPIPQSTANVIGFAVNLIILLYGWRFLENRNHATSLFILYTNYSRQRRELKEIITLAEAGKLEDEDRLYVQVDVLEENAESFLEAVEEQKVKIHQG